MTAMTATATTQTDSLRGMTEGAVRAWLRIEGLVAFGAGLGLYAMSGGNWLLLVPLLLIPDLSAAGYLLGRPVGTFTYNLLHTWAPGLIVLGLSVALERAGAPDRRCDPHRARRDGPRRGLRARVPTSFQDTHLGRIGRAKA